jgi:hypothetical protein
VRNAAVVIVVRDALTDQRFVECVYRCWTFVSVAVLLALLRMSVATCLRLLGPSRSVSSCPSTPSRSEYVCVCAYVCACACCCSCGCGLVSVLFPRTVVQYASPSRPLPRQHMLFERPFWLLLRSCVKTPARHTSMGERRVGWSQLTLIVIVCWDPRAFCR